MNCISLAPVITPSVRVLVLGSMPGTASLRRAEYYAHPRNLFWDFIEELFGIARSQPYAQRLEALNRQGVGLWDVAAHCRRQGSLDAAIERDSVVPNDFATLYARLPDLRAICFNGRAAADLYVRKVLPGLDEKRQAIHRISLPSTSPANAAIPAPEKLGHWREALTAYGT